MNKFLILLVLFLISSQAFAQRIFYTVPSRHAGHIIGQPADTVGLYLRVGKDSIFHHLAWYNGISYGIAVRDSVLFVSGVDGVLRSLDNGKTWKIVTDWRMPDAFKVYFHPKLVRTIFMVCSTGIWKSDDLGDTWTALNEGLQLTNQTYVNTLLVLPDKLVAGTAGGIVVRANEAKKWSLAGLPDKEVHDIKQDPFNPKHLVAAVEDSGVFESADGGVTWQVLGMDLQGKTVYAIAFDPAHASIIYCGGYQLGLCKYDKNTNAWVQLNNSIKTKSIHSIALEPFSGRLYVGLIDYGLFYSDDDGIIVNATTETTGRVWQITIAP